MAVSLRVDCFVQRDRIRFPELKIRDFRTPADSLATLAPQSSTLKCISLPDLSCAALVLFLIFLYSNHIFNEHTTPQSLQVISSVKLPSWLSVSMI